MRNYLVTGAAGFIGSWVARALLERGDKVTVIDNLSTGFKENIPAQADFFLSDCQDPKVYKKISGRRFDAILHIAGQSSGEISFDNPVYDLRSNTESTLHLLKFALQTGCKRFIYASTMSVYGLPNQDTPVAEDAQLKPLSFYGVGKIASEHYLRIYEKFGIQPTSLRLFNVYGPGQNLSNLRQGMISIYLAQMIQNQRIVVKGSLERFRDFVYISDVVSAFLLTLDNPQTCGGIFNIATGRKTTVKELLGFLLDAHGKRVPIETAEGTPGDTFGIYADISRFKNLTGFGPAVSLEKGLKLMLSWAKEREKNELPSL